MKFTVNLSTVKPKRKTKKVTTVKKTIYTPKYLDKKTIELAVLNFMGIHKDLDKVLNQCIDNVEVIKVSSTSNRLEITTSTDLLVIEIIKNNINIQYHVSEEE